MNNLVFTELYQLVLSCCGSFCYMSYSRRMMYDADRDATSYLNVTSIEKGKK